MARAKLLRALPAISIGHVAQAFPSLQSFNNLSNNRHALYVQELIGTQCFPSSVT